MSKWWVNNPFHSIFPTILWFPWGHQLIPFCESWCGYKVLLVLQFDATGYDISEAGLSHSTLFPPCEEEVYLIPNVSLFLAKKFLVPRPTVVK